MTPWVHVSGSENAGECRCWVLGRCLWTAVRRRTDAGQGFNTPCDSAKGPALWVRVMSSLETRLVNHICTLALNSTNLSGAEVCHLIIFECLGENVDHTAYEYSQTGWRKWKYETHKFRWDCHCFSNFYEMCYFYEFVLFYFSIFYYVFIY